MNQINSIPKATNREPVLLKVVDPVNIAIVVIQVAVPGIARIDLRRTPPVTGLANGAERSIVETVTARKT